MPILRIVLSLFLGLTLIKTHPASAQAPSSAQVAGKPSVLSEVFPQPTGQNGYEEILAALRNPATLRPVRRITLRV